MTFAIEAKVEGIGVYVKITLEHPDKSFVYPTEARIDFNKEEMSENKAAFISN